MLEGEVEVTFRGKKSIIRIGDTINIPTNAPHNFKTTSNQPAQMLAVCSPAWVEELSRELACSGRDTDSACARTRCGRARRARGEAWGSWL